MPELIPEFTSQPSPQQIFASESQWVSLGSPSSLTSVNRLALLNLSKTLAASSPIYGRLISAFTDLLVPPGLSIVFDQEQLPSAISTQMDWFWDSGPSALRIHAPDLVRTLIITGELFLKPRVNKADGRVTLTYIDQDSVESVGEHPEGFKRISSVTIDGQEYRVISRSPSSDRLEGDIFYFRFLPLGLISSGRGLPLLTPLLDDIASFTELAYKRVTKLSDLAGYYWEVTLTGAPPSMVADFINSPDAVPPETGQIFAHNDQVAWNLIVPEIRTIEREISFYINAIAGYAGLAPEFIGHAPSRDISTESLFTSISHLDAVRDTILRIISDLVTYQLEQAADAVNLKGPIPSFSVVAPTVGSRSLQRGAQAFARFADGMNKAVQLNIMTKEEAAEILRTLVVQLGLRPSSRTVTRPFLEPQSPKPSKDDTEDQQASEPVQEQLL